jgi:hypothetical protein
MHWFRVSEIATNGGVGVLGGACSAGCEMRAAGGKVIYGIENSAGDVRSQYVLLSMIQPFY